MNAPKIDLKSVAICFRKLSVGLALRRGMPVMDAVADAARLTPSEGGGAVMYEPRVWVPRGPLSARTRSSESKACKTSHAELPTSPMASLAAVSTWRINVNPMPRAGSDPGNKSRMELPARARKGLSVARTSVVLAGLVEGAVMTFSQVLRLDEQDATPPIGGGYMHDHVMLLVVELGVFSCRVHWESPNVKLGLKEAVFRKLSTATSTVKALEVRLCRLPNCTAVARRDGTPAMEPSWL